LFQVSSWLFTPNFSIVGHVRFWRQNRKMQAAFFLDEDTAKLIAP
jgi:hypothetical protein